MNQPKISIIIPVYNAELYIHECLASILKQTYKEYEVILINDGSMDDSPKICDEYAKHNSQIKVFHTENQGAGLARNRGLDEAMGEYVCFVDSDDWLEDTTLEIYMNKITHYDLLIGCSHNCYYKDNKLISKTVEYFYPESQYETKDAIRHMYVQIAVNGVSHAPHNKLYRRSIIEKHQLRFPNYKKYEDLTFNNAYIDKIESMCIINDTTYNYRVSNLTNVAQKLPEDMFDIFKRVNNDLLLLLTEWGVLNQKSRQLLQAKFITDTASCLNNAYNPTLGWSNKKKYDYIKQIIEDKKVQQDCLEADGSLFVNIIAKLIKFKQIRLIMLCYQLKTSIRQLLNR